MRKMNNLYLLQNKRFRIAVLLVILTSFVLIANKRIFFSWTPSSDGQKLHEDNEYHVQEQPTATVSQFNDNKEVGDNSGKDEKEQPTTTATRSSDDNKVGNGSGTDEEKEQPTVIMKLPNNGKEVGEDSGKDEEKQQPTAPTVTPFSNNKEVREENGKGEEKQTHHSEISYITIWNILVKLKSEWMKSRAIAQANRENVTEDKQAYVSLTFDKNRRKWVNCNPFFQSIRKDFDPRVSSDDQSTEVIENCTRQNSSNNYCNIVRNFPKTSEYEQADSDEKRDREYASRRLEVEKAMDATLPEREIIMKNLSKFVRKKLDQLQNPRDCNTARILVCGLMNDCGFGCELHFLLHCLLLAVETNRTMILQKQKWAYAQEGWEYAMLPLSNCAQRDMAQFPEISDKTRNERIVKRSNDRYKLLHLNYAAWTIPSSLAPSLLRYHGDPFAWWTGQLITYLMRPTPWFQVKVAKISREINFSSPIVGIHIRRGDKEREASLYAIEEYMTFVKIWFRQLGRDGKELNRRLVYVATDDQTVMDNLRKKYPKYHFIGNPSSQGKVVPRAGFYNKDHLNDILVDLHFLPRCDYFVGTGSSNVGRAVYELMNYLHTDPSTKFETLDIAYFNRGKSWLHHTVENHKPSGSKEIELKIGDEIVEQTRFNGYICGSNQRTKEKGLFPISKVRKNVYIHDFQILH